MLQNRPFPLNWAKWFGSLGVVVIPILVCVVSLRKISSPNVVTIIILIVINPDSQVLHLWNTATSLILSLFLECDVINYATILVFNLASAFLCRDWHKLSNQLCHFKYYFFAFTSLICLRFSTWQCNWTFTRIQSDQFASASSQVHSKPFTNQVLWRSHPSFMSFLITSECLLPMQWLSLLGD